ncbi:hypothetical protein VB713_17140, partial [Anabaena cylindrica UHCC 0172]|nr:hypothetical protein [Anabaena cylindrica UHCC 0172]
MNLNRTVVVTAIFFLAGTFGSISLNQVNAANPSYQIAQASPQPNQRPPHPDFQAAAAKLGVTEQQLKAALGVPANPPSQGNGNQRPPRPDFKTAAAKLGVTEQQLKAALGVPANPPSQGNGNQRPPRPDF